MWIRSSRWLVVSISLVFEMFQSWKKQDCTSLFMCELKCKLWSKITPRFLEEGLTLAARGPMGGFNSGMSLLGPKKRTSVLSGLN